MSAPLDVLNSRLTDHTGVYVENGADENAYLLELAEDIRANICQPLEVHAIVMSPGLPGYEDGDEITGWCVAKARGCWLVYRPEDDLFYAFWGENKEKLGAHGVFGSPLYCWSA